MKIGMHGGGPLRFDANVYGIHMLPVRDFFQGGPPQSAIVRS